MKQVLALLLSAAAVAAVAVVFFSPVKPDCWPAALPSDMLGVDVPAEPVPVATSRPVTARVATWNTLYSNRIGRVVAGLRTISKVSDVIGVQELSSNSRRAAVEKAMLEQGWASTQGNTAVRILYNAAKYQRLAEGVEKVPLNAAGDYIVRMEGGTAGSTAGPKSLQWVQLQDRRTGGVFFVVNHHIVPDIDRKGRARPGANRRVDVATRQRAAALSVIAKLRRYGPVALTEDANVDNRAAQRVKDPRLDYVQMTRAGMASSWTVLGMPSTGTQTRGRRVIDKVSLTMENGRFLRQQILDNYGSDHKAAVATIANRAGATRARTPTPAATAPAAAALPTALTVPGWRLDAEQIGIAATAIGVGKQLGIPERGWVVAITAALTESGMRNLTADVSDRDSEGPWQMRPSTGWGTPEQIRTIDLAARAFYGLAQHTTNPGLVDIDGWDQLSVGEAAQRVEVSAYPSRYAPNEAAARAVVAALAGLVDGGGTSTSTTDDCAPQTGTDGLPTDCPATTLPAEQGLTPDALLVLRCVHQQFPEITSIGGVRADPIPDHPSGRAVDLMIPDYQTPAGKAFGWKVTRWLQAHQRQLGVQYLIFDNQIWNIKRADDGWRKYRLSGQGTAGQLHTNHVHVTVFGDSAEASDTGNPVVGGAWAAPLPASFTPGCGFRGAGCRSAYGDHTGQDYPAPPGTEVYAVTNGTVIKSESLLAAGGSCTTLPICGGAKRSYGNLLVIRAADGGQVTAWYAHLTERRVAVGEVVRTGQVIGTVGYQGRVIPQGPGGSHLHFEIRLRGTPVNPLPYLRTKGIQP